MEKTDLNEMINQYGKLTMESKTLKTQSDVLNKKLKSIFQEYGLNKYETDLFKVGYQVRESESLDEEAVINILVSNGLAIGIVKQRPYIDNDALESAIYNELLPQEIIQQISDCVITKKTQALTIKEIK